MSRNAPRRIIRKDWRERARQLCKLDSNLSNLQTEDLRFFEVQPWEKGIQRDIVFPHLPGIQGKAESISKIQTSALSRSRELGAQYNIYTDGSASEGVSDGGAGVVVTTGDASNPTVITTIQERGATLTCSYEEEKRALELALDWIEQHVNPPETAAVYTDSQSICSALLSTTPALDGIRAKINGLWTLIAVQWIPGHSKIPGNEMADDSAKQPTARPGNSRISYGSACSRVKVLTKDPPITNERIREVYGALSQERESRVRS